MFPDTTIILDVSDITDRKILAETVTGTPECIILGLYSMGKYSSACESKAGNLSFPVKWLRYGNGK